MVASEPCERLLKFVDEVVRPLPHVRQRENALLYVRGLIEQGGRKSLQPTLFRLEETPARYESMQQFLADSPWRPELLVLRELSQTLSRSDFEHEKFRVGTRDRPGRPLRAVASLRDPRPRRAQHQRPACRDRGRRTVLLRWPSWSFASLLERLALRARVHRLGLWGRCPRTPYHPTAGVGTGPPEAIRPTFAD